MDVALYTVTTCCASGMDLWWGTEHLTVQITIEKRFARKVEGQRNFKNEFKDGHSHWKRFSNLSSILKKPSWNLCKIQIQESRGVFNIVCIKVSVSESKTEIGITWSKIEH